MLTRIINWFQPKFYPTRFDMELCEKWVEHYFRTGEISDSQSKFIGKCIPHMKGFPREQDKQFRVTMTKFDEAVKESLAWLDKGATNA